MANEDNPYLNTVKTAFGDDGDSDLRSSLIQGMKSNPDQAAKALPFAREKQIPLDMAERNLPALEEEDRFKRIDFNRVQKETPMLGDFLRDRENASLAHDDMPFLEKVHKTLSDVPVAIREGQNDVTLGLLRDKQLRGVASPADVAQADALSQRERPEEIGTGGFFSNMVTGVAGQLPVLSEVGKQSAAGAFIGAGTMAVAGQLGPQVAIPEELVTVPGGAIAGSMVGAFNASRSIEGGLAYDEFLSMKDADGNSLDPSMARGAATIVGITNGAIELLPLGALVKTIPGADKVTQYLTKDGIKAAMQFPGVKTALADIGKRYANLAITEGTTEIAQEAVTMYVGELTKALDGGEFESPSGKEQAARLAESGKQGMTVALGLGLPGTAINTGRVIAQRNKQPDPEMVAQYLKNAKTAVTDPNGKLFGRSKEKTRDYLNRITGNQDIFVDGEAVQTFYQTLTPEDQAALDIAMPDFAKRMEEAAGSKGDIAINRADYHTYMQPLDTKDWLDQNARFMPDHFSAADVAEYDSFMEEMYGAVNDLAGAEQGEIVQNNFYNQLLQRFGQRTMPSGKNDVAKMLSENPRAFYETMMERAGDDPRVGEILNRLVRDVEVQRNFPENLGAALQRTDFDLMIDRLRKGGTAKKREKKTDLFGQTKQAGAKATKAGPKPVIDALAGMGRIKKGSGAAKRLAEMDITPKRYPKLFAKDGAIEDLGAVSLSGLQDSVGNLMSVQGDSATDAYYADAEWLASIISDEDFGKGAQTQEQIQADMEALYMEDLERSIAQADIDLLTASNAEIKVALQRALDEQRADPDGQTFNQGGKDPQGSISFTATGKAIIRLFEKEDLSTVLHELGHLYWRTLTEIASLDNPPEQIAKDVDTVRAWAGAKPLKESTEPLTVEQEEKIADGFLAYLREGKAPSVDLQTAFSRFKGWMTRLYRGIRDTLPTINNDVRDVFDRMLATDDAIEGLAREPVFQIDTAIMSLLPKAQAQAMQRKMDRAIEDAKNRLFKKALKQSEAENTQTWKDAKAKLEEEIGAFVSSQQVYTTMDAIREAGGLSRKAVVADHGKEMLPYLSGHTVKGKGGLVARSGGVDPATIAGLSGYVNSRAMMQDLMNAKPKKARIDELVEEEMLVRYGDMLRDGSIEREALEAMHNELRLEVLEMEKDILADLAKIPAPTKDGIKAKAIQIMADSKVKDILPQRRLRSENKAYFDYGKALGKKDYVAATRAKAQQILNHHLYRMSLDARVQMDKKMSAWRRMLNRSDEQIGRNKTVTTRADGSKSAGPDLDYVYAARAVLAKYGIGSTKYDFETFFNNLKRDNPDAADTLLQAYTMLTQGAPDWQASAPNVRGNVSKTAPYKNLSWSDFQALSDAVDNLIEVGRDQKFIEIEGKRVAKQEALDELSAQTAQHKDAGMPTVSEKWGAKDKARQRLWNYASMTTRVERWVKDMDKGYNGIFRKYLWQPIQDAVTGYRDERKTYMDKIIKLLKPHKDRLHGEPIPADELVSTIDNKAYTFENKAELIGMMAHLGNGYESGSNGYKLLVGNGWARFDEETGELDTSNFKAFMARMFSEGVLVKEDMDLVQSLWTLTEELKPAVWKAHKRMYGFYPNSVTAVPFMTPFGEYKGGYWPAIVDKTKSRDAANRENKRIAENENNITAFPTTGRGATKSRVDAYAAPLEMSLRLLPSHMDWALRFVHIEPAVKDAAKLLMDKDFSAQLERVSPGAVDEMLFPWLQRAARQATEMPVQGKGWRDLNSVARWARQTTGVLMMAGNLVNIAMQATGVFPLIYKVGAYNFGRAWVSWAKSPSGMSEAVNEASAVMRHAQATFLDQDYQRHVQRLIEGYTVRTKMEDISQDFGYIGQKLMQNLINNVGWTAAYNQAYAGSVKGIDKGDDLAAIRYADTIVSETQGFNNAENISRVESSSALGKLFLVFYSYFNNQGNFLASEVKAVARADQGVAAKAGRFFYFYLMCYMAPSFLAEVIGAAMRGNMPDDDDEDGDALEEWFQFFMMSQAKYISATVPYFGQIGNYALGKFTDVPFDDQISASPVFSTVEKIVSAPFSVYKAMFDEGDASKAVGDTLTAVGALPGLGMPAGFAMRPAKYVADVMEGDSEAENPAQVLQGISTGRSSPED